MYRENQSLTNVKRQAEVQIRENEEPLKFFRWRITFSYCHSRIFFWQQVYGIRPERRTRRSRENSSEHWKQIRNKPRRLDKQPKERKGQSWKEFSWNANRIYLLTGLRELGRRNRLRVFSPGCFLWSCLSHKLPFDFLSSKLLRRVVLTYRLCNFISALITPLKWFWQRSPMTWLLHGIASSPSSFSSVHSGARRNANFSLHPKIFLSVGFYNIVHFTLSSYFWLLFRIFSWLLLLCQHLRYCQCLEFHS